MSKIILNRIIVNNGSCFPIENIKLTKEFNSDKEVEIYRNHINEKFKLKYKNDTIRIYLYTEEKVFKDIQIPEVKKIHLNELPDKHKVYADWLKNK